MSNNNADGAVRLPRPRVKSDGSTPLAPRAGGVRWAAVQLALEHWIARRTSMMDIVRRILVEELHVSLTAEQIDPDAALFGTGLQLDSIDSLELVIAVESEFGIQLVERDDLVPTALRTLNSIVDAVIEQSAAAEGEE